MGRDCTYCTYVYSYVSSLTWIVHYCFQIFVGDKTLSGSSKMGHTGEALLLRSHGPHAARGSKDQPPLSANTVGTGWACWKRLRRRRTSGRRSRGRRKMLLMSGGDEDRGEASPNHPPPMMAFLGRKWE